MATSQPPPGDQAPPATPLAPACLRRPRAGKAPGSGSSGPSQFPAQAVRVLSKEKKDRWKEEPRLVKIRNDVTLATRREKLLFGAEGIRQDKALAEREGSRGQVGGTDGGETEGVWGQRDMIQKRRKGELKLKRDKGYFGLSWCLRGKESTCQCRKHGVSTCSGTIPRAQRQRVSPHLWKLAMRTQCSQK